MAGTRAQPYWNDWGALLLVGGLLLAPAAWFLDLQASYALVKWVCAHDRRAAIVATGLGSLLLMVAGGAMSWRCWIRIRSGAHEDGGQSEDRSYVLALCGLGLSALFALLVVTSTATRLLSPCR
jgi:hypothetical protein